ncbi:MAG TPA: methyltransferase domain-containing protein [Thermoanaerobaculia bacterium]|jgi:cyclopropane fatty-acyl-phospholipid synthase-like methyltransferase|nr:methyltransferase domain-containing protein [Thermoanaerobaculia bacterium]
MPVQAFDDLATDYDAHFTVTPLGTHLRQAVWRRLDARFSPGDRILELGCGTGEDAVHLASRGVKLLATDASVTMVETARKKVAVARVETNVEVRLLSIEDLETVGETFDGAFSSFGGLNCVADLAEVARTLSSRLRPGAPVLLCVMGPLVPWEWLGFLLRGRPSQAFRRLRRGGASWRGITVRYPSIRTLRSAFAPEFRLKRVSAIGALLPPTEFETWARRHPRLLASLARWERRFETLPPLSWLADHYLAELERTAP